MRISSGLRLSVLMVLGLICAGPLAQAQLTLNVAGSPNSVGAGSNVTYTLSLTNTTGTTQAIILTNTLPALSLFQGLVPPPPSTSPLISSNGSTFTFFFSMADGQGFQMSLTASPTAAAAGGFITNSVFLFSTLNQVFNASTNVVTQVTNAVVQTVDLGVLMTVPTSAIFTNDWIVYGVSVTNNGSGTATGAILTNTLPPGVGFKSAAPANAAPIVVGSNVVFNVGSLTNHAVRNFQLTVQPTNSGVLPFVSFLNTNALSDSNPANDVASNNITVSDYLAGQFTAATNSAQIYDAQDGLVEQSILVSNTGTNAVPAARVIVTGLTNQRLFNAVGTNNGNPYVVFAATLDTNQTARLLLQYAVSAYFPFTNSQLQVVAVSVPNLTPPAVTATSSNLNITRFITLTNAASPLLTGDLLIEFLSVTGRTYTVVYSDGDSTFSNALMALPPTVAPASRTQWIDYGPPLTVPPPTNSPARFYRVYLNP